MERPGEGDEAVFGGGEYEAALAATHDADHANFIDELAAEAATVPGPATKGMATPSTTTSADDKAAEEEPTVLGGFKENTPAATSDFFRREDDSTGGGLDGDTPHVPHKKPTVLMDAVHEASFDAYEFFHQLFLHTFWPFSLIWYPRSRWPQGATNQMLISRNWRSVIWHSMPLWCWINAAAYASRPKRFHRDGVSLSEVFAVPFILASSRVVLIAIKYATLTPTELHRFMTETDPEVVWHYTLGAQLISGWLSLRDDVLRAELDGAASRLSIDLSQLYFVVEGPSSSSGCAFKDAATQRAAWQAWENLARSSSGSSSSSVHADTVRDLFSGSDSDSDDDDPSATDASTSTTTTTRDGSAAAAAAATKSSAPPALRPPPPPSDDDARRPEAASSSSSSFKPRQPYVRLRDGLGESSRPSTRAVSSSLSRRATHASFLTEATSREASSSRGPRGTPSTKSRSNGPPREPPFLANRRTPRPFGGWGGRRRVRCEQIIQVLLRAARAKAPVVSSRHAWCFAFSLALLPRVVSVVADRQLASFFGSRSGPALFRPNRHTHRGKSDSPDPVVLGALTIAIVTTTRTGMIFLVFLSTNVVHFYRMYHFYRWFALLIRVSFEAHPNFPQIQLCASSQFGAHNVLAWIQCRAMMCYFGKRYESRLGAYAAIVAFLGVVTIAVPFLRLLQAGGFGGGGHDEDEVREDLDKMMESSFTWTAIFLFSISAGMLCVTVLFAAYANAELEMALASLSQHRLKMRGVTVDAGMPPATDAARRRGGGGRRPRSFGRNNKSSPPAAAIPVPVPVPAADEEEQQQDTTTADRQETFEETLQLAKEELDVLNRIHILRVVGQPAEVPFAVSIATTSLTIVAYILGAMNGLLIDG